MADPSASPEAYLGSVKEPGTPAVSVMEENAESPAPTAVDFGAQALRLSRELDDQLQRRFEVLNLSAPEKADYVADARSANAAERRLAVGISGRS